MSPRLMIETQHTGALKRCASQTYQLNECSSLTALFCIVVVNVPLVLRFAVILPGGPSAVAQRLVMLLLLGGTEHDSHS